MKEVEMTLEQFEAFMKGFNRGRSKRLDDRIESYREELRLLRESLGISESEVVDSEDVVAEHERVLAMDLQEIEEILEDMETLGYYDPAGTLDGIDKRR